MFKNTKKFVKEHKYQIIAGTACVATGVVSILLYKEINKNKALSIENAMLKEEVKKVDILAEKVEVIHEAMSEGMIQEAIATTTRKHNTRLDIIARFKDKENLRGQEKEKLNKAIEDEKVFSRRLKVFNKLADTYTIEE